MRAIGIIALWFGLGFAVTDLMARTIEQVLATAPMYALLVSNRLPYGPDIAGSTLVPIVSPPRP